MNGCSIEFFMLIHWLSVSLQYLRKWVKPYTNNKQEKWTAKMGTKGSTLTKTKNANDSSDDNYSEKVMTLYSS